MAEAELEAKQVVGEEAEKAPKKRVLSRGMLIFAAVFVLEAIALFFVFDMLRGGGHGAEAAHDSASEEEATYDFKGYLEKARQIDIGEVSIWDETDPSPRASRRFTANFAVWIDQEAMKEIELAEAKNPDALNRVRSAIKGTIHQWMLQTGGEAMKGLEMQHRGGGKVRDFLNENLAPLRNRIVAVEVENFRCARN